METNYLGMSQLIICSNTVYATYFQR